VTFELDPPPPQREGRVGLLDPASSPRTARPDPRVVKQTSPLLPRSRVAPMPWPPAALPLGRLKAQTSRRSPSAQPPFRHWLNYVPPPPGDGLVFLKGGRLTPTFRFREVLRYFLLGAVFYCFFLCPKMLVLKITFAPLQHFAIPTRRVRD